MTGRKQGDRARLPDVYDLSEPGHVLVGEIGTDCEVLGPGRRAVLWVAGCPLRCRGCMTPELLSPAGGEPVEIDALAEQLLASDPEGVTFSGGEPFWQPSALTSLSDALRAERPGLSLMSYSGMTLGWLRRHGSPAQLALLSRLDLLIDGPYSEAQHASIRWRGSANQRIRVLTSRHADVCNEPDLPAGLTYHMTSDLRFQITGVPPIPRFRERLAQSLAEAGLEELADDE